MSIGKQRGPRLVLSQMFFAGAVSLAAAGIPILHGLSRHAPVHDQSSKLKDNHSKAAAKNAPKEVSMPFRVGETLNYRVSWSAFTSAATVQLSVAEQRELLGWATWHFRASAHTLSPVRSLFTIDDQFDSYTDRATLESRQFELYLDEMGRKQNQTLCFVAQGQPARSTPVVVVQPGTRDPLGALYALRGVDWQQTPEFRAPVYDGHNLLEMRAHRETSSSTISVGSKSVAASRVAIRVFQFGKEVSGTSFMVWFANDAAKTPVAMQAEIPFGTLRVELTSSL
jgi:hypothetical protein